MADQFIKTLERVEMGTKIGLNTLLESVKFNENGLIPAIAQQYDTHEVLMMAWMNREALEETLETFRVCYFSRSRNGLWRKGEKSGQIQLLQSLSFDCDADTLLLKVDQTGPACHSGRRSCFYITATDNQTVTIDSSPLISPEDLYK